MIYSKTIEPNLAFYVQRHEYMRKPYVIGLFGGSGVGKTTLAHSLALELQPIQTTILSADHFYKPISEQVLDEAGEVNFDLPTALNEEALYEAFDFLCAGKSAVVPVYTFNTSPTKTEVLHARELLLIEGLYLPYFNRLKERIDLLIYVEVDPAIQLARKIERDIQSRAGEEEKIRYQWYNHCIPCEERYIKPYIADADFRIDTGNWKLQKHLPLIQTIKRHFIETRLND